MWNIDKHRSLHLATTAPAEAAVEVSVHREGIQILRSGWYRRRAKDGAVVARFTYNKGTREGEVTMDLNLACRVVFDEATAGMTGPVMKRWTD